MSGRIGQVIQFIYRYFVSLYLPFIFYNNFLFVHFRFAHCININFYQDLVNAIDGLIEEGNLGLREQLHCVQCIFTILSGQAAALNIDPHRFVHNFSLFFLSPLYFIE